MGLDDKLLVFLLDCCVDLVDYLVNDVVDMSATLGCADAVHEGNLLELAIT